jgi:hypothetical protein
MAEITIADMLGLVPKDGDIGIEIEVEGRDLPRQVNGWQVHIEPSLRPIGGHDPKEYVLPQPISFPGACRRLRMLREHLRRADVVLSDRTSVHVHINVQKLTVGQWFNFVILYLLYEDALLEFCGETRKGNLFCLSSFDAEGLIFKLEGLAKSMNFNALDDNDIRYASMNIKATPQYGSIEFRAMRGTVDIAVIEQWLRLLLSLREKACTFEDPHALLKEASKDAIAFTREVFPFALAYEDFNASFKRQLYRCYSIVNGIDFMNAVFIDEPLIDI